MKRAGLTKQAPHPWPFSHGVTIEGPARLVFLAGQVAFDRHGPDRQLVGVGDPAAQTRQPGEAHLLVLALGLPHQVGGRQAVHGVSAPLISCMG